jgi:hypothetical protein
VDGTEIPATHASTTRQSVQPKAPRAPKAPPPFSGAKCTEYAGSVIPTNIGCCASPTAKKELSGQQRPCSRAILEYLLHAKHRHRYRKA